MGKAAKQIKARRHQTIIEGYTIIVGIDMEKFFDKVNNTIKDSDLLSIISKYLISKIMINRVVMERTEGTPQACPFITIIIQYHYK